MLIYNTLTKKKEEFKPINHPKVKMYTCGVTVYDHCHIGHGRSLYVFEVMRRYLKFKGYKVDLIRNITDVDDKIINKAKTLAEEEKISLKEAFNQIRDTYIGSYYQDLDGLSLPKACKEPLATENIKEMIKFIKGLIDKKFAYQNGGNVYFKVRSLNSYGQLSGKKIDDLYSSVRIDQDSNKLDPLDFALWKTAKIDEPSWDSPWGKGRPGWHIECSVMARKYLKGDTIDIHGGGLDLVFPHHENELAQSKALTGKEFAKVWIHHGLITVNKEKMAKSLGNFFTIKEVLKKYPADVLKLFYLGAHYSSPIDFSWEKLDETKKAYERIDILRGKLLKSNIENVGSDGGSNFQYKERFIEAMDDDFNMPKALGVLFEMVNKCNKAFEKNSELKPQILKYTLDTMEKIADIFCLDFVKKQSGGLSDSQIKDMVDLRLELKKAKKFNQADKIRDELDKKGIIIEDTKDSSSWRRKI